MREVFLLHRAWVAILSLLALAPQIVLPDGHTLSRNADGFLEIRICAPGEPADKVVWLNPNTGETLSEQPQHAPRAPSNEPACALAAIGALLAPTTPAPAADLVDLWAGGARPEQTSPPRTAFVGAAFPPRGPPSIAAA